MMKNWRKKGGRSWRLVSGVGASAALAMAFSAFGATPPTFAAGQAPITIGVSASLTGDFSSSGIPLEQGYKLWENYVNSHGGILGRKVKIIFLNDNSSTSQVATNYEDLITRDKVDIVFGPYSSLLTVPALEIADRYGYAFEAPAGGGPAVFALKSPNFVFVQPTPVSDTMVSFAKWILSLPKSERPTTAAYATEDGPFSPAMLQTARNILQSHGIKTVYDKIYPTETTDFLPMVLGIEHSKAQIVLLGTHEPEAADYVRDFVQQHYNPKAIVFTGGPEDGTEFLDGIGGAKYANGIMVPGGWWYGEPSYQNKLFVSMYVKTYGGKPTDVPTTAAEAFSVGQVFQQAAEHVHSINNAKIIKALHTYTFNTVQGPMKFNAQGAANGEDFLMQWQHGKLEVVYPNSIKTAAPLFPKPNWP
ncbi:MAG: amino acid ABC transporter substrate-binding protein [Firmicutes bacterium]|nr:amino acid ABC transporter substrate-binding protein [Bacillota bacterium]